MNNAVGNAGGAWDNAKKYVEGQLEKTPSNPHNWNTVNQLPS